MSGRRVALVCPSRHWGFAYDASGTLTERCRGKECRTAAGKPVIHAFDLATGGFTAGADEKPERAKEQHDGRHADQGHR